MDGSPPDLSSHTDPFCRAYTTILLISPQEWLVVVRGQVQIYSSVSNFGWLCIFAIGECPVGLSVNCSCSSRCFQWPQLYFKVSFYSFMCMSMLPVCVYEHHVLAWCPWRKKMWIPWDWSSRWLWSTYHVGAGNPILGLCKTCWCSYPESSLQPCIYTLRKYVCEVVCICAHIL